MSKDGVTITFELRMKPEALAGFLEALPRLINETAAFEGFRTIRIVQHGEDPTRILFVELWDTEEAYRKYIAFRNARGDMDSVAALAHSMTVNIWPSLIVQI